MNVSREITGRLDAVRKISLEGLLHPTYLLRIEQPTKNSVEVLYLGPLPEKWIPRLQGNTVTFREINLEGGEVVYDLEGDKFYRSTSPPFPLREHVERAMLQYQTPRAYTSP